MTEPNQKSDNTIRISIGGIHCPTCALNIEKSLRHLSGVKQADVNFIGEEVTVKYDANRTDIERIKEKIVRTGYTVRETAMERAKAYWSERIFVARMIFCAVLIVAAWLIEFFKIDPIIIGKLDLCSLLSLIVIVIGGYPIFKGALQALMLKDLTVFSLVSIATIAAVIVGAYKEAGMVILIMLVGETLEHYALRRGRKAITKLMNLAPVTALVKYEGNEIETTIDNVKPNDILIIKPGVRIPVDGIITKGASSIDESTLTGEATPADKKESDTVYSGTINEGNAFEMQATHTGDDTRFNLIKRLILEAEAQKAPIQRIADRYAKYFVPLILLMSVVVYAFTGNSFTAITILIVACPCALVLATPTAVVAGLTNASHQGIIIKGGQYLEMLGELDVLLIDKTGTLTSGKLSVTDIVPLENTTGNELLLLAALAEKHSEHPIAKAIIKKANQLNITVPETDSFKIFKGSGVRVNYRNDAILVGNHRLLTEQQIVVPKNTAQIVSQIESQGKTALLVVRNNQILGIIGLTDTPKPNASTSITKLKQLGFKKIACISGDNQRVTSAVANELGLDEYYAQMMPEDKVNKVKQLKQEGFKVGMVGDGVNDAPALASSDVGLAMGAFGSDVAIEAADVSLMSDDLSKIPATITLSRRVLAVIKQNFVFSIAYNILMLILVTYFVHDQHSIVFGAVAHQLSSLIVISNSLRLLR